MIGFGVLNDRISTTALNDEWMVIEKCIVLFEMVVLCGISSMHERYEIGYGWVLKMILL